MIPTFGTISIEKRVGDRHSNPIFHENTNVDYNDDINLDTNEITSQCLSIECNNFDFEIKSLVILYDKLIKWFKMINKDCGISEKV